MSHMKTLNYMLQVGPPSLHYYCTVVFHSHISLPPIGHSSNQKYHCCQLTDNRAVVRIFIAFFKVFIWLSLVLQTWHSEMFPDAINWGYCPSATCSSVCARTRNSGSGPRHPFKVLWMISFPLQKTTARSALVYIITATEHVQCLNLTGVEK